MRRRDVLQRASLIVGSVVTAEPKRSFGASPLKIGMIVSSSGPSASNAAQFTGAIAAFFAKNGQEVAGRRVEILQRDGMGPAPDVNLRLTQELVSRQGVELIFGYDYTPNVLAVKKFSNQARVPVLVENAATSGILKDAPYMVRFGFTTGQVTEPLARWMAANGVGKAYALFANYGPGLEARTAFKEAYTGAGGSYMGELPVPVVNPDFSSYLQRIKEARPDGLFVFLPSGDQPLAFLKAARDYDLTRAGIRIFGTGDIVPEDTIDTLGDAALGVVTVFGYSDAHESPENQELVRLFRQATGDKLRPDYHAATVWDIMTAIYKVVAQQNGTISGDRTIELLKGYKAIGARGPIEIDPNTRDLTSTVYLREVKRVGGRLVNVEFDAIPNVRSPDKLF